MHITLLQDRRKKVRVMKEKKGTAIEPQRRWKFRRSALIDSYRLDIISACKSANRFLFARLEASAFASLLRNSSSIEWLVRDPFQYPAGRLDGESGSSGLPQSSSSAAPSCLPRAIGKWNYLPQQDRERAVQLPRMIRRRFCGHSAAEHPKQG